MCVCMCVVCVCMCVVCVRIVCGVCAVCECVCVVCKCVCECVCTCVLERERKEGRHLLRSVPQTLLQMIIFLVARGGKNKNQALRIFSEHRRKNYFHVFERKKIALLFWFLFDLPMKKFLDGDQEYPAKNFRQLLHQKK